jgi:hypothetical protein
MSSKQQTDRTFERAWVQGIKVADGLRRRPSAVRNAVLRPRRKSTHQVNPSVETAEDELPASGVRHGTV